jgi:type IV secretory pathway VirB10-like protein
MAEVKRGDEAEVERTTNEDATVITPRLDERDEATARPVVPLDRFDNAGRATARGFSLRANSRHLLLAWAVIATLTAGAVSVYKSAHSGEPQGAPQPAPESTTGGATATPTPQTVRREVRVAPARAAKMTDARDSLPLWEAPAAAERADMKWDEVDKEELDERARKEEKRRRKEEKKWREEEKERREEAEKEAERAYKESRKQAERLRERSKDKGAARLIGVITRKSDL